MHGNGTGAGCRRVFLCLVLWAAGAMAARCPECGKLLKFGSGKCAACRLKDTARAVDRGSNAVAEKVREADIGTKVKHRAAAQAEAAARNGTVSHYKPRRLRKGEWQKRSLVYINGMRTDYSVFKEDAQYLADLLGRPVEAVYAGGATRGLVSSVGLQLTNWTSVGDPMVFPEGKALASLISGEMRKGRDIDLVCHSRGTMLTEAVLKKMGGVAKRVRVFAFGCAVSGRFPVEEYYKIVNRDDFLMQDRMVDKRGVVWGPDGGHGFRAYLANMQQDRYDKTLPLADSLAD